VSTVGIVALSLLAGLFIALLIGVSGWLVFIGLSFRKTVAAISLTLAQSQSEWTTSLKELRNILSEHRSLTDASIKNINGEKLSVSVEKLEATTKYLTQIARRNENAAIAIGRFVQHIINMPDADSVTEGVNEEGYAAAEPGERSWTSRSRVAIEDAAALAAESEEVTSSDQQG
jgi:hypothetical protein